MPDHTNIETTGTMSLGEQFASEHRERIDRLLKKRRLIKLENGNFQDPKSGLVFINSSDLMSGNDGYAIRTQYELLKILDKTGTIKIKSSHIRDKPKKDPFDIHAFVAEQGHGIEVREDAAGRMSFVSQHFPERQCSIINPTQQAQVAKIYSGFKKEVDAYAACIEVAESHDLKREQSKDRYALVHPKHRVELTGKVKDIEAKLQPIYRAIEADKKKAEVRSAKLALLHHKPSHERSLDSHRVEMDKQLNPRTTSSGSDSIVSHHAPYRGKLQDLNEADKLVVFLDSGVLFRCFPTDRQMNVRQKGNRAARRAEAGRECGELLFESLLENPKVAAVIIPDFIADMEVLGRRQDYAKDDEPKVVLRSTQPGNKYYSKSLISRMKQAIRRHNMERVEAYYCDPTAIPEPKLIIWESDATKQMFNDWTQGVKNIEGAEQPVNLGEKSIEALLASNDFQTRKNVVISADYNYLENSKQQDHVCHMDIGDYVRRLISGNEKLRQKFASLAGIAPNHASTPQQETEAIVKGVQDLLSENVAMQGGYAFGFPYCDNKPLADAFMPPAPVATLESVNGVHVNGLAHGKANQPKPRG